MFCIWEEPKIKEIFADFGDAKILTVESNSALLLVSNTSQKSDKYYLHESRKLDVKHDVLPPVYPDGTRRNILNTKSTPNTFYG